MAAIMRYAKAVAAVIGAGVLAASTFYPTAAWLRIAIAVCTAIAVGAVTNTPASPKP